MRAEEAGDLAERLLDSRVSLGSRAENMRRSRL
jgi:hypothetical protein